MSILIVSYSWSVVKRHTWGVPFLFPSSWPWAIACFVCKEQATLVDPWEIIQGIILYMVFLKTRSTVSVGSLVLWGNSEIHLKQMSLSLFYTMGNEAEGFIHQLPRVIVWRQLAECLSTVVSRLLPCGHSTFHGSHKDWQPEVSGTHWMFQWEGRGPRDIWASLVAQMVTTLPAMQETQVWSLGQEDPLEKETATHCSILAWRIPWTVAWWATVHGVTKSRTWLID